jgi:hypothetical protein
VIENYRRETKGESILTLVARHAVSTKIDIGSFGYSVAKTLYGQEAKGATIAFKSKGASAAVWLLKN